MTGAPSQKALSIEAGLVSNENRGPSHATHQNVAYLGCGRGHHDEGAGACLLDKDDDAELLGEALLINGGARTAAIIRDLGLLTIPIHRAYYPIVRSG